MIRRIVKKNISAPYVGANVFHRKVPTPGGVPAGRGQAVTIASSAATQPLHPRPARGTRSGHTAAPGAGRSGGRGGESCGAGRAGGVVTGQVTDPPGHLSSLSERPVVGVPERAFLARVVLHALDA